MSIQCVLGIDMGGTEIKASLVHLNGEVLKQKVLKTSDTGATAGVSNWMIALKDAVGSMNSINGVEIKGLGISVPGVNNPECNGIVCMPDRLAGLTEFDWNSLLPEDVPYIVMNDAKAALLGEVHYGCAKGIENVFMVTLGTGVGGALMLDGKIYQGHRGVAGHLGHISLDVKGQCGITGIPGALEDSIGNSTVEKRTDGNYRSTLELVRAVESGNSQAQEYWDNSVHKLACGLASLTNVLDPEAIIIGGGIARAGEMLFKPLQSYYNQYSWNPTGEPVRVISAELGTWSGSLGIAQAALQHIS